MKLLLDTCVSGAARQALEADEHDVIWSVEWDSDPGDEEILGRDRYRRLVSGANPADGRGIEEWNQMGILMSRFPDRR